MQYWLLKTEPETWSWTQQCAKGTQGEWWDGVRNHQASNNMKRMQKGDQAFFYHSGKKPCIVGIVQIIKTAELDPSDPKHTFVRVCVQAHTSLKVPVTLQTLKKDIPTLAILKQSRLSVAPVQREEWEKIIALGGLD